MKKVHTLPVLVTLGNAFCGFLAIAYIGDALTLPDPERRLTHAAWLILLAMLFDAFDGKIARLTGSTSELGVHLDSLSDVISFGVAPAFLAKVLLERFCWLTWESPHEPRVALMLSVLFVACAALRLARYNVTAKEDSHAVASGVEFFRGLPTPGAAAAMAIVTITFFDFDQPRWISVPFPFLVPALAWLMVSRIPYPHLLNHLLRRRRKFTQVVQLVVLAVIILFFPETSLALGFLAYLAWGPVMVLVRRISRRREPLPGVFWTKKGQPSDPEAKPYREPSP